MNKTWNVNYTDKDGNPHDLEFHCPEEPTHEEAAREIIQELQNRRPDNDQLPIIDIYRTDPTPSTTKLKFLGYQIVSIVEVDPHANA